MENAKFLNRTNEHYVKYAQNMADILAIFWQFHKVRIKEGNIPFAFRYNDGKDPKYVPFDMKPIFNSGKYHEYHIFQEFIRYATGTLVESFEQFLELQKILPAHKNLMLGDVPIPNAAKKFTSKYVYDLYTDAVFERKTSRFPGFPPIYEYDTDNDAVRQLVEKGANTGNEITGQLCALFGETFLPTMAVLASKISLSHIWDLRSDIGVVNIMQGLYHHPISSSVVDDSMLGLDKEKLKSYGLGKVVGCPASMTISKKTEDFLKQCGVEIPPRTMLEDFALTFQIEFKKIIGAWFASLTSEQKKKIKVETIKLLDGTELKQALIKK
jgi:hypothetical protein